MRGTSVYRSPAFLGLMVSAVAAGTASLALPMRIAAVAGDEPGFVVAFYVVTSIAAGALNLVVTPRIVRSRHRRPLTAGLLVTGALGNALLAGVHTMAPAIAAGVLMICLTVAYPIFMAVLLDDPKHAGAQTVAVVREGYVVAFVVGLGLFALLGRSIPLSMLGISCLGVATAVAAAMMRTSAPATAPAVAVSAPPGSAAGDDRRASMSGWLRIVGPAAFVVLLMKAADMLRGVYLPIEMAAIGLPPPQIAVLFVLTTACEVAVLRLLGRLAGRQGATWTIVLVNLFGVVAFVFLAIGTSFVPIAIGQLVYGVFAAGFQSIGLVMLAERSRSVGAGAGLYTAIMQLGGIVGIAAPAVTQEFTPAVFWVGAGFTLLAAAVAIAARGRGRPGHQGYQRDVASVEV